MDKMQDNLTPAYYAILPAQVRYDQRLKPMERILFAEITALTQASGVCWAKNKYFAELYGVSEKTVSVWVSDLQKYGYIFTEILKENGMVSGRMIYTAETLPRIPKNRETYPEKSAATYPEKSGDKNNTSNNNTSTPKAPKGARELWNKIEEKVPNAAPAEIARLKRAIIAFCESRQQQRKPIKTERTVQLLAGKLLDFGGGDVGRMCAVLDQSVERGWTTLYPLDEHKSQERAQPEPIAPDWGYGAW